MKNLLLRRRYHTFFFLFCLILTPKVLYATIMTYSLGGRVWDFSKNHEASELMGLGIERMFIVTVEYDELTPYDYSVEYDLTPYGYSGEYPTGSETYWLDIPSLKVTISNGIFTGSFTGGGIRLIDNIGPYETDQFSLSTNGPFIGSPEIPDVYDGTLNFLLPGLPSMLNTSKSLPAAMLFPNNDLYPRHAYGELMLFPYPGRNQEGNFIFEMEIGPLQPTPVPPSLLLLSSGLVALFGFRRKKNEN